MHRNTEKERTGKLAWGSTLEDAWWGSAEGCGKYTLKEPRAKRFLSAHQSHQVPSTHAVSLLLPFLPSFLFLDPSSTCKLQDHPFPSIDFSLVLSFLASSKQFKCFRNKSNIVEGYNGKSRVFLPYLPLFRKPDCVMVIKHGHGIKCSGDTERGKSAKLVWGSVLKDAQ